LRFIFISTIGVEGIKKQQEKQKTIQGNKPWNLAVSSCQERVLQEKYPSQILPFGQFYFSMQKNTTGATAGGMPQKKGARGCLSSHGPLFCVVLSTD
jgi:hypothetical protein